MNILKAKLNFSLMRGMGPVAEMVPPSGQKISPPPTLAEWDQGLLAPERLQALTTGCAKRWRHIHTIPGSS